MWHCYNFQQCCSRIQSIPMISLSALRDVLCFKNIEKHNEKNREKYEVDRLALAVLQGVTPKTPVDGSDIVTDAQPNLEQFLHVSAVSVRCFCRAQMFLDSLDYQLKLQGKF